MAGLTGVTSSETVGNPCNDLNDTLSNVSSSTKQVVLAASDEAWSSTDSGRHIGMPRTADCRLNLPASVHLGHLASRADIYEFRPESRAQI